RPGRRATRRRPCRGRAPERRMVRLRHGGKRAGGRRPGPPQLVAARMSAGLEFAVVGAEHAGTGVLAELLGGHPGPRLSGPDEAPVFTHTHIHRRRPGPAPRRAETSADAARVRGIVNPAYTRGWHD